MIRPTAPIVATLPRIVQFADEFVVEWTPDSSFEQVRAEIQVTNRRDTWIPANGIINGSETSRTFNAIKNPAVFRGQWIKIAVRTFGVSKDRSNNSVFTSEWSPAQTVMITDFVPKHVPHVSFPHTIPIFVISFNRHRMMRKALASYQSQSTPVELIIHDNGSDDPETLDYLAKLEADGITVVRRGKIHSPDELNNVNETITNYFSCRHPTPYAVTDCDIELQSRDSVTTYLDLLSAIPNAETVGPMLRIEDVNPTYRLFNHMMNRHINGQWHRRPLFVNVAGRDVALQFTIIDTTFGVYRAGAQFQRLQRGIRVYAPYDARHMDFYPSEQEPIYQETSDPQISHWSNSGYANDKHAEALLESAYTVVTPQPDGTLATETRLVANNPYPTPRYYSP